LLFDLKEKRNKEEKLKFCSIAAGLKLPRVNPSSPDFAGLCIFTITVSDILSRLSYPLIPKTLRLPSRYAFLFGVFGLASMRFVLLYIDLENYKLFLMFCVLLGFFRAITVVNQVFVLCDFCEENCPTKLPGTLGLSVVIKAGVTGTSHFLGSVAKLHLERKAQTSPCDLILKTTTKGSLCASTISIGDLSATRVDQTRDLLSTKPPVTIPVQQFARSQISESSGVVRESRKLHKIYQQTTLEKRKRCCRDTRRARRCCRPTDASSSQQTQNLLKIDFDLLGDTSFSCSQRMKTKKILGEKKLQRCRTGV
jgi:hypothetical protein